MRVICATCELSYDDEFRFTFCPHDTFAANDGANNFAHHPESKIVCLGHHAPDVKEGDCETRDCHLDDGIAEIVYALWDAGVRTTTSCDGTHDFAGYRDRVVNFGRNDEVAGPPALAAAVAAGMPVIELRKCYTTDGDRFDAARFRWQLVFDRHRDWTRAGSHSG